MREQKRSALLLGATGLVGSRLLHILISSDHYDKIHVLSRRSIGINHSRLQEYIAPLEEMKQHLEAFHVDDLFCCLGTTMKKAGSKEAFYHVDYELPYQAATLAIQVGQIQQFSLVTATGANPNSLFFYNRVKGQLEESMKQHDLPALHIFQPTLLLGERQEARIGEKIASYLTKKLRFLFHGPLYLLRGIHAKTVAHAMYEATLLRNKGIHIYSPREMEYLAPSID